MTQVNIPFFSTPNQQTNINQDPLETIFDRGHKRKKYENFSEYQLEILNSWFDKTIYPKTEDFDNLANQLEQPKKKIQNWFKYKRRLAVLDNESKIPQYKTKKVLSPKVFEILKEYFKENQNPTLKEFRDLAKKINLKEKQIISWFTYRRRKLKLSKKQLLEDKKFEPNPTYNLFTEQRIYPNNNIISNTIEAPYFGEFPFKRIHLEIARPNNMIPNLVKAAAPFSNTSIKFPMIKSEAPPYTPQIYNNQNNNNRITFSLGLSQAQNQNFSNPHMINSMNQLALKPNFNNFNMNMGPRNINVMDLRQLNGNNMQMLCSLMGAKMNSIITAPQILKEKLIAMNAQQPILFSSGTNNRIQSPWGDKNCSAMLHSNPHLEIKQENA